MTQSRQRGLPEPRSPADLRTDLHTSRMVKLQWSMLVHGRGMSDDKLRHEIQVLGCSARESQRLLKVIADETAAVVG